MDAPRSPSFLARPTLVRAEGIHVWDSEGRRYLDATSGAFCMQLGYSRADLVAVMAETAARLPHARPSSFDSAEALGYGQALLRLAGPPYTRVLFTSSGSEAVDAAIKIAWSYQSALGRDDRKAVLSLHGHYHGATIGALNATGLESRRSPLESFLGPRAFGPPAFCSRCFLGLSYPDCALACAEAATKDAGMAAAVLAETVPAAGLAGAVPPPGWAERIRARCEETGALWIADEVLTGFGRVGAPFAWMRLGAGAAAASGAADAAAASGAAASGAADAAAASASPDLIVFGKGASAGYHPLAGVLITARVAEALDRGAVPFRHFQTFGGNPVACAVGHRALRAYEEENLFERVRAEEGQARAALEPLLDRAGVLEVRGLGALWGVELAQPGPDRRPYPRALRLAERIAAECRDRGVLVHATSGFLPGDQGDAILLAPPLIACVEALRRAAETLAASIATVLPREGASTSRVDTR